jgi:5-oxoprolinase (ATP-hydrolysing)
MEKVTEAWHIWVDTGGTFTDCLARNPEGRLRRVKVLSSGRLRAVVIQVCDHDSVRLSISAEIPDGFPDGANLVVPETNALIGTIKSYHAASGTCHLKEPAEGSLKMGELVELDFAEEAPVLAARVVTLTPLTQKLPPCVFHLATTKSTNALLERKGDRTAFLVTKGFRDLLRIGDQKRPHLFDQLIQKKRPLHDIAFEIDERLDARGNVLKSPLVSGLKPLVDHLIEQGIQTVAIAFLHAFKNPQHEIMVAEYLRSSGITYVSCSSELAPFVKLLPRAETAVVNAYLTPLMQRYLDQVEQALGDGPFRIMTSAGGFVSRQDYTAKDSLLSGPAGGLVGAATVSGQCGEKKTIAFDMGGTSTDVARFDGKYDYQFEQRISGVRLLSPSLRIETVAAGGGSICSFHHGVFEVGPESAGASPGPAAYGAGGPLTITDVNLLLGRMDPDLFGIPADVQASAHAAMEVLKCVDPDRRRQLNLESMLQGFLEIANERMADAIRGISVREGYDPAEYALTAFGGAGGQHACRIAEMLGVDRVLFPAEAGLLSAYGLAHARMERFIEQQVLEVWDELQTSFEDVVRELEEQARQALLKEGLDPDWVSISRRIVQLRLLGQETAESVDWNPDLDLIRAFLERYEEVYGYLPENKPVEIVSIRVVSTTRALSVESEVFASSRLAEPRKSIRSFINGTWQSIPVFSRDVLVPGDDIQGPALVQDRFSTLSIDTHWRASVGSAGTLRVDRVVVKQKDRTADASSCAGDMELELFTHRFFQLVEEMGLMLERTAISTNVKERLDFSCALLDAEGELIANAPHIPVHLGAIGLCVRRVAADFELRPGDMIVTNHPGYGGSHLPDVTVISPVFDRKNVLIGFVANRAHHAELGGIRPGSMPPNAGHLGEEGVVIPPTYLYREGRPCFEELEIILIQAEYPSRSPDDNMADLQAQAAANRKGGNALQFLVDTYGLQTVQGYMRAVKEHASKLLSERLAMFEPGVYQAEESLDDGALLKVKIILSEMGAAFDFTGTSPTHPGNLNATPAIVHSVVLYVLRLLLTDSIPLNEGLLEHVRMTLPCCMLNPVFDMEPDRCPAVVGGNVETSQRLVDLLLKALKVMACSQGTMNNLIIGNDKVSYYETVCGGAGASARGAGADAVHTHMTNTAITDPEILENRYPVRLHQFEIRNGSGGDGKHKGGDGIVRTLEFLEPLALSLLTQHRTSGPYGMDGGLAGQTGRQRLMRQGGEEVELAPVCGTEVLPGDRLILETPGGGGYGSPCDSKVSSKAT